ncbi:rod shape-determining protein MreC [Spirulina sp. 06S082]|uniref:rod shape-determining protein MreC n=1 Tax=Spirulina sp. 06S082 TaxID=3110248 RepID=UPI002B1FA805|nr:rod shape-determining protein MreC [Spirulina sp. 06S082]MEA5469360.1 rod shape-determining protein MreC [Spirulina sp. 06S082]
MFTMRRWWERYGSRLIFIGLVLGLALFIRRTQGSVVAEIYYQVVRSFHGNSLPEERWTDAKVSELEATLEEVKGQNAKLQKLLEHKQDFAHPTISAPIIGRSVDHWWEQILLGRGSNQGVQEGYIVTAPGGLVGRVVKVTPNTSRVLLISDPTSKVGVKVSRSGGMGYIQGGGDDKVTMVFYEKVPSVKVGDAVVTSPASYLFLPGIPIGKVESVDLEKSPAPEVIVALTAPIDFLEWVIIHPFKSKLKDK